VSFRFGVFVRALERRVEKEYNDITTGTDNDDDDDDR